MTQYPITDPTPLDDQPIEGLCFLNGNALAAVFGREWMRNIKIPFIAFPSGREVELFVDRVSHQIELHFYGEMDLPLTATFAKACQQAVSIAEACGYMVWREGHDLRLWDSEQDRIFVLTYVEDRLVNVEVRR